MSPSIASLRPWILPVEDPAPPRVRLLCLPFAGGGAGLYRTWREHLPDDIGLLPVQLPGREHRLGERAFDAIEPLVDAMVAALRPLWDEPYALFGHSMGGLLAYELAHRLREEGFAPPEHLVVSARRPPDLPSLLPPLYHLPTPEFIHQLQHAYEALPEIALQRPALLEPFLPTMRADMKLIDTYTWRRREPLTCPITVFGGVSDPAIPPSDLRRWTPHTTGPVEVVVFPGRHFFLRDAPADVAGAVGRLLRPR